MKLDNEAKGALPCPFCAGTKINHESAGAGIRYLRCQHCSATGGYRFAEDGDLTREASIEEWNNRQGAKDEE
jgi:hypothetical protein